MYKIYNKKTDQWSCKDTWSWSYGNKPLAGWRTFGHLKAHVTNLTQRSYSKNKLLMYKSGNCELVEYKLVEVSRINMKDFVESYERGILDKQKRFDEFLEKEAKDFRYEKYKELKEEFENES